MILKSIYIFPTAVFLCSPSCFAGSVTVESKQQGGYIEFLYSGFSCKGGACSVPAQPGDSIVLRARPASGYFLSRWKGCQYRLYNDCIVLASEDDSIVVADFTKDMPLNAAVKLISSDLYKCLSEQNPENPLLSQIKYLSCKGSDNSDSFNLRGMHLFYNIDSVSITGFSFTCSDLSTIDKSLPKLKSITFNDKFVFSDSCLDDVSYRRFSKIDFGDISMDGCNAFSEINNRYKKGIFTYSKCL